MYVTLKGLLHVGIYLHTIEPMTAAIETLLYGICILSPFSSLLVTFSVQSSQYKAEIST